MRMYLRLLARKEVGGENSSFQLSCRLKRFVQQVLSTGLDEKAEVRILMAGIKRNQNAECVAWRRKDEERKAV